MNNRTKLLFAAAVLTAALAGACGDGSFDGSQCAPAPVTVERSGGALGLGTFSWRCVGEGDPTCGTDNFPRAAAVGGEFDLDFSISNSVPDEIDFVGIEVVSPSLVSSNFGFQVLQPGTVTFVAMAHDAAIDFVDLQLHAVDTIEVSILAPRPPPDNADDDDGKPDYQCPDDRSPAPLPEQGIATEVGESPTLYGAPYAGELRLGGNLSYEWHSLTPEIATVASLGGREARLVALAEGKARISVRAGDHEEIVEFEVGAAPVPDDGSDGPRRDLPEPATDSGSDSGSGGSDESGTSGGSDSGSDSDGSGSDTGGSSSGSSSGEMG